MISRLERVVRGIVEQHAGDLRDAEGRPLGEVSSPRYDEVVTEVIACPYADRRRGRPMNVTALRQLTGVWPTLLATVRALAGPDPTVHRAWRAAIACTAAPLLVPEPVPVVLAGLYKTALGLTQATTALLLAEDGVADAPLAALGGPDAFVAWLDDGGWLLGQVQVCAGSAPMIAAMLRAACGEGPDGASAVDPRSPWIDVACATVGLQAAYLAAAYGAVRRGQGDGIDETPAGPWLRAPPPWLRAVLAAPHRPPDHARRLFPAGAVPEPVAALLDAGPADARTLHARFERGLQALGASVTPAAPPAPEPPPAPPRPPPPCTAGTPRAGEDRRGGGSSG